MPTVFELSAPYENHLLPVLPVAAGVCPVCHTSMAGGYPQCYQCSLHSTLSAAADSVGFTALAVKTEQLARDLWVYKNGAEGTRLVPRIGLAAVLWRSLALHERCLAAAAGTTEFSVVTTVPSTSGRADEPVERLAQMVGATHARYRRLLAANPRVPASREPRDDRYIAVKSSVVGASVLLLDDTWTTGAHAQSAAAALRAAGAVAVGVWVVGRHFNREQAGDHGEAAQAYYRRAREIGWDWNRCCLCDDRAG